MASLLIRWSVLGENAARHLLLSTRRYARIVPHQTINSLPEGVAWPFFPTLKRRSTEQGQVAEGACSYPRFVRSDGGLSSAVRNKKTPRAWHDRGVLRK